MEFSHAGFCRKRQVWYHQNDNERSRGRHQGHPRSPDQVRAIVCRLDRIRNRWASKIAEIFRCSPHGIPTCRRNSSRIFCLPLLTVWRLTPHSRVRSIVLAAAVPEELADQASVKGPRSPGSDRPHGRGWSGGSPHPPGRPHSWGSPHPACGVGPCEPRSHDRGRGSRPSLTGGDRRGVSEKSGRSSCP